MSINQHSLLATLPVEIVYYICDCLDAKTILVSFRNICRRLRNIINNYDNYILDFKKTSRSDFQLICRLINPQQVKSLTLCQQTTTFDQTIFFDKQFHVKDFSRLRSLTLIAIKESRLRAVLKHINISLLVSFSLEIGEHKKQHDRVTATVLTSILTRASLLKLALNIESNRIEAIEWPDPCTIEQLKISKSTSFYQIIQILRYLPRLRTLTIDCHSIETIHQTNLTAYCRQLTSVSLKKLNMKITDLEFLLQSMASLINLKLTGNGDYSDGHRWEKFIQTNLLGLKNFQFYFNDYQSDQSSYPDIEQIIRSFQSPFWIELKKWFVICEYNINIPQWIKLYSIPNCMSKLNSIVEPIKISLSTLDIAIDMDAPIVVNTNYIGFNFTKLVSSDIKQQRKSKTYPLLRTKNYLALIFDSERPVDWIPFISLFIDLTTITKITLRGRLIAAANQSILDDIKTLLQQACHVNSVLLRDTLLNQKSLLTANDICSIIPAHVRHLIVAIKDMSEAKIVLERLTHVSSARFYFDHTPCCDKLHQWFKSKNLSYQTEPSSVYVWRQNVGNKRIKLTDNHHD
ncbi:unnamed protein product [Adineta steineri]|uniref:F-box domain-containing protein n=1 Tax=Adineta steineri TaxID=433720 RepID=A0A814RM98_9BILA|nr:unnamed protein product [Adineta steineri]CAF1219434.1 unnamed protein product [Adineta steineri]CAF3662731.1 unnamed protein product [Adineta steineri]CAF3854911.1 unnamed protein product [Adineta steineri]